MSFSFNFEVTGAENDLGATQKTPEKEENKLMRTLAGFEVVLPTAEQEHMRENLERSVLDLTSTKIHFFVGGQIEHLLSGDLQKVTNENLDLVPTVYEGESHQRPLSCSDSRLPIIFIFWCLCSLRL